MRSLFAGLLMAIVTASSATAAQVTVVPLSSNWRYFLGTQEASSPDSNAWRNLAFNDSSWNTGNAPIGYPSGADRAGFENSIATMTPTSTVGNYLSVFFRKTFQLTNVADLTALDLSVFVDDGAIAYINGVEVGRINLPAGPLAYNCCTPNIAAVEEQTLTLTITNLSGLNLVVGQNILAIHGFNANSTSSDFHVEASLTAFLEIEPPSVDRILPAPGSTNRSLTSIEVLFSEPVNGVEPADLLINNNPATNIVFGIPGQFRFVFAEPATGVVQVAWAAGHGITDLAGKPFAAGSWTYTVDPNLPNTGVILNEFMADNNNTLEDEDGDSEDWIELRNLSAFEVDLSGWFLTDDPTLVDRWRFPTGKTIPANGYLVVFASGKNRASLTGPLHTDFQIAREGTDYLALLDANTNVVSEFTPQNQLHPEDKSYGRDAFDTELTAFFDIATPGAVNRPGGAGFAPEITWSRPSGTFAMNQPWQLTLSTPLSNAVIHYVVATSLPGSNSVFSVPGTNTALYTGPITVNNTVLIRARAFAPGLLPGAISTRAFVGLANTTNVLNFNSHLPVVIIHNMGAGAFSTAAIPTVLPDIPVVVQTFEPQLGRTSMTNAPTMAEFGVAHARGSSTRGYPKISLFMEVRDEFLEGKNVEFLGLPRESDWILYAPNHFEPIMFKNPLGYQLAQDQGEYASRYRLVEVYFKDDTTIGPITDSDYNGIYVLAEKIKRDANRVNVAELQPENLAEPEVTGGYMWSIDRDIPLEPEFTAGGQTMQWIYPDGTVMTNAARAPQLNYIRNYFNAFRAALDNNVTWTNPVTGYAAYIDVESWVRRHIHETLTHNIDAFRLSGYFFKERGKKIEYGPAWDYDRTMSNGNNNGGDFRGFNPRQFRASLGDLGTDYWHPNNNGVQWWARLFNSPDFFQKWIDTYQEFRDGPLSLTNITNRIDQLAQQIRPAHAREIARWPQHAPRSGTFTQEGFTHNFGPVGNYENEVRWLGVWFSNRLDFFDTNFLARPTVSVPPGPVTNGTVVTLSPAPKAGSWVYYTLDGTDPRLSSGGILATAIGSDVPVNIVVSNNTRIYARSWNPAHRNLTNATINNPPISSPWSGVRDATFFTHVPPLRITEIMYHPQDPAPNYTNDVNFEYIEVKNIGGTPLNLNRFTLRGGVDFDFPNITLAAGESGVIVANQNEFIERYGTGKLIIGQYAGDSFGEKTNVLDNAGERLILRGGAREPILDFEYDDDWYPLTDGFGFSLVVVNDQAPTTNWVLKSHWRMSGLVNGSPGANDSEPPVIAPIVINEVLTHSDPSPPFDSIELFNPTTNDVNIGGWFLTDDFSDPRKFRIQDGTLITAGGLLVFDEEQFNSGFGGFSLSSLGEEVYLFSADPFTEDLTGYYQGFDFGPAENGRTFGRHITSTGGDQFPPQVAPSLGAPNIGPLIGPIVISEIHYRPPDFRSGNFFLDNDFDEYIELANTSATSVPLHHPQYPTNTWKLGEAVDYVFPPGVVLPPGGHLLVVSFDPADAAQAATFRARNYVPENVPLYGPFDGKLDNSGEAVELERPDRPEPPGPPNFGLVPYLLVERVRYSDSAPWPGAADGLGPSLQRISGNAYGNDPASWVAAAGSPGTGYQGGIVPTITQQPTNTSVLYSFDGSFSVQAQGTGLRYQWLFNDGAIDGATNATLALSYVELLTAGQYRVVVLGSGGSAVSSNATLTVVTNSVVITLQPQNTQVVLGRPTTNRVMITSSSAAAFRWLFNGSPIPGATSSNYVINPAGLQHTGVYQLEITDDIATIYSRPMTLTVTVPPLFVQLPQSIFVPMGSTATVSVLVTNNATLPITYRWRHIGVPANDVTNVNVFSTSDFLTVRNVTTSNRYSVVVFNAANAAGSQSPQFFIAPIPDADADGMPDSFETQYGFDINSPADAIGDLDGDGMRNLAEYVAGTDPSDPSSYLFIELVDASGGPSQAMLRFMAVSNKTYSVQFSEGLASDQWSALYHVNAAYTNRVLEVVDPSPNAASRFYRLATPKQ